MKFRGLDSNSDWQFGQGLGSYAKLQDALNLSIRTRVLSWLGNCFFDSAFGIDWTNRLDKGQEDVLVLELNTMLLQTDGVVNINVSSISQDPKTRRFSIQYDIQTIFTKSFVTTIKNVTGVQNG